MSGHYRSLEVIWRLFGGESEASKSNRISAFDSVSRKKTIKLLHFTCPKGDLVTKGHLRSLEGRLEVNWWIQTQI